MNKDNWAEKGLRVINPNTGKPSDKVVNPGASTKVSNKHDGYEFLMLKRFDKIHKDYVVRIHIRDPKGHVLNERDYHQTDRSLPFAVTSVLKDTRNAMEAVGAKNLDRLVNGKQSFTEVRTLPYKRLAEIGWHFGMLTHRHPQGIDFAELSRKARLCGIAIDASSIIRNARFRGNGSRALQAIIDALEDEGVSYHVYCDHSLRKWLHTKGDEFGIELIDWLYRERRKHITTSRRGHSADELILKFTYLNGWHIIARDEYDEGADWLDEAASAGYPRVHKYYYDGFVLRVPDIGLEVELRLAA